MNSLSPTHHPPPPPPPPPPIDGTNFGNKISPSILIIIVILAAILFISGLLHLLVRYLLRSYSSDHLASSSSSSSGDATVLQGQLRQLFHLHDAGVDQSFIDALPVFVYKSIVGRRRDGGDPFGCVVCLCEFEPDDKLRLLPKCSHAFHLHCIDTWLLSHSTCPLCRRSLIPEFPPSAAGCSPVVLLFESGGESSRSIGIDRSDSGLNPDLGFIENGENFIPIIVQDESKEESEAVDSLVVSVKLGTFKNVSEIEGGGEGIGGGGINLDQRRCLSMGSYEYVMDDTSTLQVAIKPLSKNHHYRPSSKNRLAMSECDRHSKREGFKSIIDAQPPSTSSSIGGSLQRRESFSFSKIWLRKPKAAVDSSRRWAASFRKASGESKVNCQSSPSGSDFITAASEKCKSEIDFDLEVGSCNNSIGSFAEEAPSFSRRTMLWILGRQNKVGNHG